MKFRPFRHTVPAYSNFFQVGARSSSPGVFTCDQCLAPATMPVIWQDLTFCEWCWDNKKDTKVTYTRSEYKPDVCECGKEKSGALGHLNYCPIKD